MIDNNKTVFTSFLKQLSNLSNRDGDDSYDKQLSDFLLRYYIGISDLRAKGPLVDCGLSSRIEKYLSLAGKIFAIETLENKIELAYSAGEIKRDFWTKNIIKADFIFIDDQDKETYKIRVEEDKDENKKTVVRDGNNKLDITINPEKIVDFVNNEDGLPDQIGIEFWQKRLRGRLEYIDYDAKKCRKKMAIFTRTKMDGDDKQDAIDDFERNDYIFNISFEKSGKGKGKNAGIDPSETNYKLSGPENSQERVHLWNDYYKYLSEAGRFHGVPLQVFSKEERQNIPETLQNAAAWRAWEKERKRVREKSYRRCEKLGWIEKGWELNYGTQTETNEQKIKKLEEELKLAELEEKLVLIGQKKSEQEKNDEEKKKAEDENLILSINKK